MDLKKILENPAEALSPLASKPQTTRSVTFEAPVVVIDGQPGCGKTMLSPIVAALDRVELLTYAYEIEYICALRHLNKIDSDAAVTLVKMFTDLKLYNTMMGREANLRFGDLSSIWRDAHPLRYLKRLLRPGDEAVPGRVAQEKPILNLTTHNLLRVGDPLFSALGPRLTWIEVVRHPLYMVKQQALNWQNLTQNVRNFTLHFDYKGQALPYYAYGWEETFARSNPLEKAVYFIYEMFKSNEAAKTRLTADGAKVLTISFEQFVINPWPAMQQIEAALGTTTTATTKKVMKKQKVPRKMYAAGLNLKIYERCGWQPPQGSDETAEFRSRWEHVAQNVSKEALDKLAEACEYYEDKYLGGKKGYR